MAENFKEQLTLADMYKKMTIYGNITIKGTVCLRTMDVANLGHHMISIAPDNEYHVHPASTFDGELTTRDVHVIYAYNFTERKVLQADDSGLYTGTNWESQFYTATSTLSKKWYLKTGPTVPISAVTMKIYMGTDANGPLVLDQTYAAALFVASSEIELPMDGYFETEIESTYYTTITCDTPFSIKTNAAGTASWTATDDVDIREDNLLQTRPWADPSTWTEGDYFMDSRKIYVCNTTGEQTGTFASNSALWDELGTSATGYKDRIISSDNDSLIITDTSLTYNDAVTDRIEVNTTQTRFRGPGASPVYMRFSVGGFEVNDGVDRFMSNASKSIMAGPNDVWWSGCYNDKYEVMDYSIARIQANATDTRLIAPDGNSILKLSSADLNFNDGTRDRIEADAIGTTLRSTTGAYLSMLSETLLFNDSIRDRIIISDAESRLASPDGLDALILTNSTAYLTKDLVVDSVVTLGADGVTLVSDDLVPSFNIVGNGEVFRVTQAQGTNGFFMSWFDYENNRMSYYGHGQSANQQHLWLVNEMTGGNLIIDTPGIVDIQTILQTDGYKSTDGTTGITYTANNGSYTQLIFKNGLLVGAS